MNSILKIHGKVLLRKKIYTDAVAILMCSNCIQKRSCEKREIAYSKMFHKIGWPSGRVTAKSSEMLRLSRDRSQWCASSSQSSWCNTPTRPTAKYSAVKIHTYFVSFPKLFVEVHQRAGQNRLGFVLECLDGVVFLKFAVRFDFIHHF